LELVMHNPRTNEAFANRHVSENIFCMASSGCAAFGRTEK
jgi:hypothetical protein